MLKAVVMLGALLTAGPAFAQTPQQPSEVLRGLGGHCWEADLGEGATDTHCFSVARNGHLVMDVHKVRSRSGGVVYEGVTLYRVEPETGAVRYDYYNSNGGLLSGYARRDGDRILFPDKPGQPTVVVWYLTPDHYESGPVDETQPRTRFVRTGKTEPSGF